MEPDLQGAYNICREHKFTSTQEKYCPFCGRECEHVAPERRCQACGVPVRYAAAKFCSTCGAELEALNGQ